MKKLAIFHLILFFTITCNAFELADYINMYAKRQGDKIYLSPEAVEISSNKICFVIDDFKIPLTCLTSDEQGLYVNAKDFEKKFYDNFAWCSNCHTLREYDWDGRCKKCGLKIAPGF